uniref:Importin-7/11-like TPR repeats domain-containing protein n=1 Tax=Periophthalmus magnuspinnatus TaxID=409849 RepID=A0A3B4BKV2_9GOBI
RTLLLLLILKLVCVCVCSLVPLQLALEDPVHAVSLQQVVYEKLKAQQSMMGDQGFSLLMETVDTELVRQLQEFLQVL